MMWFWGSVLGLFAGASIGGWSGAFWGAVVGWVIGLLLGRKGESATAAVKQSSIEQRLAMVQKTLEDTQRRLARLEQNAGLAPTTATPAADMQPAPDLSTAAPIAASAASISASAAMTPAPAAGPAEFTTPIQSAAIAPAVEPPVRVLETVPDTQVDASPEIASAANSAGSEPATAAPVAEPASLGWFARLIEGNIVAKLGVVILFFGVGFLLKFAYDRGMFPPEMRLFAVAAASAVMFVIGGRLLNRQRTYAIVLMGGAMGLLYLDVFFALKTFALIGPAAGFALFAALGVATLWLAVKLDARAFAALGLTGAFMAPILASTGSGNHVLLFSYYLLLNLVILAASWLRSWRELNFIGFLFTFAIALLWGNSTYRPEHFATVEPFLIAFFLLYLAIPILFAHRQPPELKGVVDATLVFGMPLSVAMLQTALTRGMEDHILAWSALAAAIIYGGLAWLLWRRDNMRLLAEAHLALALVFGTVAPYFAFDGYPTFAFWTLEGAAIYWIGCRQKSVLARGFAVFLQVAAAVYFWSVTYDQQYAAPWWNDRVVGCGLIAAASLLSAWFMHRFEADISELEADLQPAAIGWGGAWLLAGIGLGTWAQWDGLATRLAALLLITSAIFAIFEYLGTMLSWRLLRLTSRVHALLLALIGLWWFDISAARHPLAGAGAFAWPISFIVYFAVLHRQRAAGIEADRGWRYTLGWLVMMSLATWEAMWRYDHREYFWVWAIGAAGVIASALRFRLRGSVSPTAGEATQSASFLSNLPLWWSLAWWFAGIHGVIDLHAQPVHFQSLHLAAGALSILLFELVGGQLAWRALRHSQVLLTGLMLWVALGLVADGINPFRDARFFAWLLAFAASLTALWRQERDGVALLPGGQHLLLYALALWLLGSELVWRADMAGLSLSWQFAAAGVVLAGGIALLAWALAGARWPFAAHPELTRHGGLLPLLVLGLLWTLFANAICDGEASPLPYLPLVNPLDLAQLAIFAAAVWSLRQLLAGSDVARMLGPMLVCAAFYWVNAALLRTVHQWAGVPFELDALLRSVVAQSALSLLWTSTALVLMFAAGRSRSRALWMTGAALLGVVVLKLFVNDLGNTGTVARIVSFIGVGVLLLVIGYVAPVPPPAGSEKPAAD